MLIVHLDNLGRISDNDALYALYEILERNRGEECTLPKATLMRQVLDIAAPSVRQPGVFHASFRNGEDVLFYRTLPPFVTLEGAINACQRHVANKNAPAALSS